MQCFTVFELCVAIEKSEELLILDTLWLSLWKLIGSVSCPSENPYPSFLELMISSHLDYSFNILFFFFFEEYFCTLLRHSDFFLISVIFLISTNSIPMPLKKKIASCCSFHLLLPFWGYYWEVSFFFFLKYPPNNACFLHTPFSVVRFILFNCFICSRWLKVRDKK